MILIKKGNMSDDKGHQVLSLLAENGFLEARDLFVCQHFIPQLFVSYEQIRTAWRNTSQRYYLTEYPYLAKYQSNLGENFDIPRDEKFDKLKSTTYAKQKLKLTEDDIEHLKYEFVYIKAASAYFPFYRRKDLFPLMYLKHGVDMIVDLDENNQINNIILPRNIQLYRSRFDNLMKLFSFMNEYGINMKSSIFINQNVYTRKYLQNGKNMRDLELYVERIIEYNLIHDMKGFFGVSFSYKIMKYIESLHDLLVSQMDKNEIKEIIKVQLDKWKEERDHKLKILCRKNDIEESPHRQDLKKLIPNDMLYDHTRDLNVFIEYVKKYNEKSLLISQSKLKGYITKFMNYDINMKNIDDPIEDIFSEAQKYADRNKAINKSPYKKEIIQCFNYYSRFDLNNEMSHLETVARKRQEENRRRNTLIEKMRESNLDYEIIDESKYYSYCFYPSKLVTDLIKGVKNNYEEVIDELEEAEFFRKIEKILGTHFLLNSDYDSSDENLFKKKKTCIDNFWKYYTMSREEYKEETNKKMNEKKSEKQKKEVFRNRQRFWDTKVQDIKRVIIHPRIMKKYLDKNYVE